MSFIQDILEPSYAKRKKRRYRIVKIRGRAPIRAAITCTYFSHRPKAKKTLKSVKSRILKVGRFFLERIWELGKNELWLYCRGLSADAHEVEPIKLRVSFGLFADCCSRCVIYARNRKDHKPCNRANFCPHCWASQAARQFQLVRQVVNDFIGPASDNVITVTAQAFELFHSSNGIGGVDFSTPEERYAAIVSLRKKIEQVKKHIAKIQKQAQRNTIGSVWRIVVIPDDMGWRVQLRQLFLTTSKKKPPLTKLPRSKQLYRQTVNLRGGLTWMTRHAEDNADTDMYNAMILFNMYPFEWLTEDLELTAIYLNATAKMRLLAGTGKLKKIGSSLVRQYVKTEAAQRNVKLRAG